MDIAQASGGGTHACLGFDAVVAYSHRPAGTNKKDQWETDERHARATGRRTGHHVTAQRDLWTSRGKECDDAWPAVQQCHALIHVFVRPALLAPHKLLQVAAAVYAHMVLEIYLLPRRMGEWAKWEDMVLHSY
eukprot:scaffold78835_cov19-Tisochrysis_lutea.AAC.3